MSTLQYITQQMFHVVWDNETCNEIKCLKSFGWTVAGCYSKRTIHGAETVTVLTRTCSVTSQLSQDGPAFVHLTKVE